jgi:hypothetical protein
MRGSCYLPRVPRSDVSEPTPLGSSDRLPVLSRVLTSFDFSKKFNLQLIVIAEKMQSTNATDITQHIPIFIVRRLRRTSEIFRAAEGSDNDKTVRDCQWRREHIHGTCPVSELFLSLTSSYDAFTVIRDRPSVYSKHRACTWFSIYFSITSPKCRLGRDA